MRLDVSDALQVDTVECGGHARDHVGQADGTRGREVFAHKIGERGIPLRIESEPATRYRDCVQRLFFAEREVFRDLESLRPGRVRRLQQTDSIGQGNSWLTGVRIVAHTPAPGIVDIRDRIPTQAVGMVLVKPHGDLPGDVITYDRV